MKAQVLLGLLVLAIVAAQIATGRVMLRGFDPLLKDAAPRAFWIVVALEVAGAAYLFDIGLAR